MSYPRRGGIAPTTAPTQVFMGCICFRGVYTNAYRTRLETARLAAIILACENLVRKVERSITPFIIHPKKYNIKKILKDESQMKYSN